MTDGFGEHSTVSAVPGLITQYIDEGEAIIHHPNGTVYYGLNTVGSRIWSLIQIPTTVKHVNDILLLEYDVEQDQCMAELVGLLKKLSALGLIEHTNGEIA